MGCLCESPQKGQTLDEGEMTIQEYEASLGFSHLPIDVSIAALRETSEKAGFSLQLVRAWLSKLNISTVRLDSERDSVACLYASFLEKGRYSACKLGLLAILLGEGSVERKATLLFRLYCKKEEELFHREVENMVETACILALQQLPVLAERETTTLRDFDVLRKLQKYTESLAKPNSLAKSILLQAFPLRVGSYSEAEFVELIKDSAAYAVSARGLRAHACTALLKPSKHQASASEPSSAINRSRTSLSTVKFSKSQSSVRGSVKTPSTHRHG